MTHYEIITGQGSTTYSVSVGARGPAGPAASLEIDFASPDPIGSVTPNTGAFTTLSATGTATLPHIHGSLAGDIYIHVKNTSGGPLTRGTPVYIVGNVGDTDRVQIAAADNTDPAKMPAVGLLDQDLANNADGDAVILGELPAANTNAYTLNQELFVGVGALTGTKPTTGEVQSVGVVSRVQSNSGVIVVNMQGRRKTDVTTPTADTIVLRDPDARIHANQIRLYNAGLNNYTQINPALSYQNLSFQFPSTAGTIATNNSAAMLTGNQTISGIKTFTSETIYSGNVTCSGTGTFTNLKSGKTFNLVNNDVLNLSAGNFYFLKRIGTTSASRIEIPDINLVDICSISLFANQFETFLIEVYVATFSDANPANTTTRIESNNTDMEISWFDSWGSTTMSFADIEQETYPSPIIRQSSGTASTFRRTIKGLVTISSPTILKLQVRQSGTSGLPIYCRAGAFIVARQLSN